MKYVELKESAVEEEEIASSMDFKQLDAVSKEKVIINN